MQADPDLSAVRLNSTIVRMHVSAAGAPKPKDAEPARAAGAASAPRSPAWRIDGRLLSLRVTGGQRLDCPQAQALEEALGRTHVLPDRGPGL